MKNTNKSWSPKPIKDTPIKSKKSSYATDGSYRREYDPLRGNSASKSFIDKFEDTHSAIYDLKGYKRTENGALGYESSGSKLVDLNFAVGSLRAKDGSTDKKIISMFREAWKENPEYAVRWLMMARDIRGGKGTANMGERHLFRVCMADLAKNGQSSLVNALVPYVAIMGRYDDLLDLLNISSTRPVVLNYFKEQFKADIEDYKANKPVSLMAKWCPSTNASSTKSRKYGLMIAKHLGWSERDYRKTLSALRERIDVVERKMSSQNWQAIDYEKVPSRANLIYNNAFLKNDEERRRAYLGALEKGEAKINAGVLYPHDIVHKYHAKGMWHSKIGAYDSALEAMWANLPNYDLSNTMVVADGSGSMINRVGGTQITALDVANALAIYCSEHNKGEFKDKYITFSRKPKLVDFSYCKNLREKLIKAERHTEVADTNIEAVFDLILNTAKNYHMSQDEIPKQILIISDMEFNSCAVCNSSSRYRSYGLPETLFGTINQKFVNAGYKIPKLVFWNVNSRTNAIPVRPNDGFPCSLVSGFSPAIVNMVMSDKTSPYDVVVDAIMNERYDFVSEIMERLA